MDYLKEVLFPNNLWEEQGTLQWLLSIAVTRHHKAT